MTTQAAAVKSSQQNSVLEQKIQKLRELYADAPELGKAALEDGLPRIMEELTAAPQAQTAGRIGARQEKVSEKDGRRSTICSTRSPRK